MNDLARCPISWVTLDDLAPGHAYLAADGNTYDKEALKAWLLRHDFSPLNTSCSLLRDVPALWPEDEVLSRGQRRRAWLRNYTTELPRTWSQQVEAERTEMERVLLLTVVAGVALCAALIGPVVGRRSAEGQRLLEGVRNHFAMVWFGGWALERGPRLLRRAAKWYVAQEPPEHQVRRLTDREKQRVVVQYFSRGRSLANEHTEKP